MSLIFVTGSIRYLLGSLLGGRIYGRLPGHRVMAASLLIMLGAGAGGMLLPWWIGKALASAGPRPIIRLTFIDIALNVLVLLLFIFGKPGPGRSICSSWRRGRSGMLAEGTGPYSMHS